MDWFLYDIDLRHERVNYITGAKHHRALENKQLRPVFPLIQQRPAPLVT